MANKKNKQSKFGIAVPFPQTSFIVCAVSVLISLILLAWTLKDRALFMPAVVYTVLVSLSMYLAWITTSSKAHGLNPSVHIAYCLFLSVIGIVIHLVSMANHSVESVLQSSKNSPDYKDNIIRNYYAGYYTGVAMLIHFSVMVMIITLAG